MTYFCRDCKSPVSGEQEFCAHCGRRLIEQKSENSNTRVIELPRVLSVVLAVILALVAVVFGAVGACFAVLSPVTMGIGLLPGIFFLWLAWVCLKPAKQLRDNQAKK